MDIADFGFVAPIILALLINEVVHVRPKKIIQTVSYLPYFISWVVVSGMVISILSPNEGIVNIILSKAFGIEPSYFLGEPHYFRSIVTAVDIWKNMGMNSVYYLAAMMSINTELYEATSIDGGGRWRQTWHITLPGIKTNYRYTIYSTGWRTGKYIGFDRIFFSIIH